LYKRQAEKEGMMRAVEILNKREMEKRAREARKERMREERRVAKEREQDEQFAALAKEEEKKGEKKGEGGKGRWFW
jgi:cytochrome c oxidase assembly protein subunit 20